MTCVTAGPGSSATSFTGGHADCIVAGHTSGWDGCREGRVFHLFARLRGETDGLRGLFDLADRLEAAIFGDSGIGEEFFAANVQLDLGD